jgi:hypothetical protein
VGQVEMEGAEVGERNDPNIVAHMNKQINRNIMRRML